MRLDPRPHVRFKLEGLGEAVCDGNWSVPSFLSFLRGSGRPGTAVTHLKPPTIAIWICIDRRMREEVDFGLDQGGGGRGRLQGNL